MESCNLWKANVEERRFSAAKEAHRMIGAFSPGSAQSLIAES
jgi:hypothetical protein